MLREPRHSGPYASDSTHHAKPNWGAMQVWEESPQREVAVAPPEADEAEHARQQWLEQQRKLQQTRFPSSSLSSPTGLHPNHEDRTRYTRMSCSFSSAMD